MLEGNEFTNTGCQYLRGADWPSLRVIVISRHALKKRQMIFLNKDANTSKMRSGLTSEY